MEIDKMFTDPLMSIIDAGANMFLEYIQRVLSGCHNIFWEKWKFINNMAFFSIWKAGKDAESIAKSKAMLEDRNYVKVDFYKIVVAKWLIKNLILPSGDAKWVWEMGQLPLPGK